MLTRLKGTRGGEGGRGLKIALVPHLPFLVCTRYAPKGRFLHQGICVAPCVEERKWRKSHQGSAQKTNATA